MIFLDTTTRSLEIDLAGAVAATELPFVTHFVDLNTSFAVTDIETTTGTSNGTTAVTLVAAPGASTFAQIKTVSIYNADSANATVTVQYNDNTTIRIIVKVILEPTWTLQYEETSGWRVTDENGVLQTGATIVDLTGTPSNDQVAIWTDANTLEGSSNLTLDSDGDLTVGGDLVVSGTGPHTIGGAANNSRRLLLAGNFTSEGAGAASLLRVDGVLTGLSGDTARLVHVEIAGDVTTQGASQTITTIATLALFEPRITVGSGDTVTNSATLYIASVATEATNDYAIWVEAGAVRLASSLWVESTPTEGASGEQLTSGGAGAVMTWAAASSLRKYKTDIVLRNETRSSLDLFKNAQVYNYRYLTPEYIQVDVPDLVNQNTGVRTPQPQEQRRVNRKPSTGDFETQYVGLMAEEAPWAMHWEGKIFNPISFAGHTVLAVQELDKRIATLEERR